MKNTLLITSLAVGLALTGCNKSTKTSTAANDRDYSTATPTADQTTATTKSASDRVANAANSTASDVRSGINSASTAISNATGSMANTARMTEWHLNASDIQADLDAKKEIVRTKDAAGAPTGKMDKSTLKAAVEGRLKADSELASFKLDVDPGSNGEINLDGKVNTADQAGKAIALALDTDGVSKVKSKITLDKQGNAPTRH
jgi:osmotically-inducible protein OsmY